MSVGATGKRGNRLTTSAAVDALERPKLRRPPLRKRKPSAMPTIMWLPWNTAPLLATGPGGLSRLRSAAGAPRLSGCTAQEGPALLVRLGCAWARRAL